MKRSNFTASRISLVSLLISALMSFSVFAESSLEASYAWVRAMPPGVKNSAAYMVIRNSSSQPIVVHKVSSNVAMMVQLHGHTMEDGMMQMREEASVTVPANGSFTFAPGGYHIMLMGLKAPLQPDTKVELNFETEAHGMFSVEAIVSKEGLEIPTVAPMHH